MLLVASAAVPASASAQAPDVTVSMVASTIRPGVNAEFDLFVRVGNVGAGAADDVRVVFSNLPVTLELLSATISAGTTDPSTLTWLVGRLEPRGTATLQARLRAVSTTPSEIRAQASTIGPESNLTNAVASVFLQNREFNDYEDANAAGTARCWSGNGVSTGGFTVDGVPTGRTNLNPPPGGFLHVVSSQLSGGMANVESPWMQLAAGGVISLRSKITNNTSGLQLRVLLVDPATEVATQIFSRSFAGAPANTVLPNTVTIPSTGIFKVRVSTMGTAGGNSRIGYDDVVIDGTSVASLPACEPDIPGNEPPQAVADFATSGGSAVAVNVTANDIDPDGSINPATVDLAPLNPGRQTTRSIRNSSNVEIGTAAVDAAGIVTVTPAAGFTGTLSVPYSVKDQLGEASNVSALTVVVGDVQTDVSVAKTGPVSALGGSNVEYRVTVANEQLEAAVSIAVTDTWPGLAGPVTVTCASEGASACGSPAVTAAGFTATIPGIAAASRVVYTIRGVAPAAGTIVQTASAAVGPPVTDPVPDNNSATVTTTVEPVVVEADVSVDVSAPSVVSPGGNLDYTITVGNLGPQTAANVVLNFDVAPAGLQPGPISDPCTGGWPCALGTLAPNTTRAVTVSFSAPAIVTANTSFVATAEVSTTSSDPAPSNNSRQVTTLVSRILDLGLASNATPTVILDGEQSEVVISIGNSGPNTSTGTAVAIVLPTGATVTSAIATRGAFSGTSWDVGTLGRGDGGDLRLTIRFDGAGPANVSASIASFTGDDTNPSNDATAVTVTVQASADLSLLQTTSNDAPQIGTAITLVTTLTNDGPSPASGILVSDQLPAGLLRVTAVPSQGSFDAATGTWDAGSLAPGAAAALTSTVAVRQDGALQTRTTILAADQSDPRSVNNSSGVALNIGPAADMSVEAVTSRPVVEPGDTFSVRVTVVNRGPSQATTVVVNASIPPGVTVFNARPSAGAVIPPNQWSIPALAPGASATLDLDAVLTDPGLVVVPVAVSADEVDPEPSNNLIRVIVSVVPPTDVAVGIVAGNPAPLIGDDVTVFINARNPTLFDLAAVGVATSIPQGLAFVSAVASAGTFDPSTSRWTVGPLPAGNDAALTLQLRVTDGGPRPVQAALALALPIDSDPGNNLVSTVLDVIDPTRTVADLLVRFQGPAAAAPGSVIRYDIRGENFGSTYAVDETIAVSMPAGTTFLAVDATFGSACSTPPVGSTGEVRCVWAGQSLVGPARLRRVFLDVLVGSVPDGTVLAAGARVSSLTPDPTPSNDGDVVLTVVSAAGAPADLEITGVFPDAGAAVATPLGARIVARVTARNVATTPIDAGLVRVSVTTADGAPALTALAAALSQGSVDPTQSTWSVGPLPPGGVATLDVTWLAARSARARIDLRRIQSTPVDGNSANDRAMLEVDIVPPGGGGRFVAVGNTDGVLADEIISGGGLFETPQVQVFGSDGVLRSAFLAFDPRFPGGVRVAACDIDLDGRDEVIAAAGMPDGGPHIRIFKLQSGGRVNEVNSWYAFGEPYRGGVHVACGDVDGDGLPEVIAGSGTEGPATVRVWKAGIGTLAEIATGILPSPAAGFGLRVASCDMNGDGRAEVLTAPAGGGPPVVSIFDFATARRMASFAAAGAGGPAGVHLACGDILPAAGVEVLIGQDVGGSPIARAFSATGDLLAEALIFSPSMTGGVRVGVGEVDGDRTLAEFAFATGLGAEPVIAVGTAKGPPRLLLTVRPNEVP